MTRTALRGGRAWLALAGVTAALGAVAFACGSDDPGGGGAVCDGSACDGGGSVDGATSPDGTTPVEDASRDAPVGDGGPPNDAGDAGDAQPACLGPAGTLDPTFGDGGIVVLPFAGGDARAVAVQSDGKIVVAGKTAGAGAGAFAVARLMPDGSLDPTFGNQGVTETIVGNTLHLLTALVLQPDGKILAAGQTRVVGDDFAVLRYLADGSLDGSFGAGGVVLTDFSSLDSANAIALLADGRIVVAGHTLAATGDMAFARYNPDGSLDATFGSAGKVTIDIRATADQARAVAVLADGKLLASGTTRDPDIGRTDVAAVQLTASGSLDPSFADGGRFVRTFGGSGSQGSNALAIVSSGGPLMFGFIGVDGPRDFLAIQLTAAGAFDQTFGAGGVASIDFQGRSDDGNAVMVQEDGKLLLAGSSLPVGPTPEPRIALARHVADGGLDPSFGAGGRVLTSLPPGFTGSPAKGGALAKCGAVVVGGWVDELAGTVPRMGVVRYRR